MGTICLANPFKAIAVILLVFPLEVNGDRMKWTFPIFAAILLIAGITACTPSVPANQQPAPAETVHPLTARTGIEEIDRILDA